MLTLAPNEVLVAYSDGVSECLDDAGEEFGEVRVAQAIGGHLMMNAADLCRTLVTLVREYRGGAPPADDVTVLVIKRVAA